jgi:hypothetical protein
MRIGLITTRYYRRHSLCCVCACRIIALLYWLSCCALLLDQWDAATGQFSPHSDCSAHGTAADSSLAQSECATHTGQDCMAGPNESRATRNRQAHPSAAASWPGLSGHGTALSGITQPVQAAGTLRRGVRPLSSIQAAGRIQPGLASLAPSHSCTLFAI